MRIKRIIIIIIIQLQYESRKCQKEAFNRRTIEIPQRTHIFKINQCLKVYNEPLKLVLPILG